MQELEQDPEVKALYDDVNARYQEALNSDPTLHYYSGYNGCRIILVPNTGS